MIGVTGAAGFIGSNMVRFLCERGYDVHAIDRIVPDDPHRLESWKMAKGVSVLDLRKERPFLGDHEYVLSFAADMGGCEYIYAHDFDPYVSNSRITFNMFEAARHYGVKRIFFPSSACIYPVHLQTKRGDAPLLREDQIETGEPDHMYGREKLMLLRLAERFEGDARIGIFHTIYGIGQERSGNRMKFPAAAIMKTLAAQTTGSIDCWGDGSQLRSYLYIDDALEKIWTIIHSDHYDGPVNVGKTGAISCADVIRLCCSIVGIQPTLCFTDGGPSGIASRDCDNTKWDRTYGPRVVLGYEEGFARTIEWAKR